MAPPRATVHALSFLLVSAAVTAQTVWNVTAPNGIQAVIAAASPGDVIVLTSVGGFPDYHPFNLNKGVTIRGNGARIGNAPGAAQDWLDVQVPAGQVAHVEQVDTSYSYAGPLGSTGCTVYVHGGSVRFEQCTLRATRPLQALNSTVVVSGGTVTGIGNGSNYPAIEATDSHVTLRDCAVVGAPPTCSFPACTTHYAAQPALAAFHSTIHAERVQFTGGAHNVTSFAGNGAPAAEVIASTVRLADCTLTGGASNSGTGGAGLMNSNPIAAELRNTALVGGTPGGLASLGPINPNAPLLRLALAPAWLRGATSVLTCSGDANTLFALALAPDVTPANVPVVVEPVWFVTGAAVVAGVLDPAGTAILPIAVPNVPSLQHLTVWCQAVSGNALPLRASTLAGGAVQ